MSIRFVDETIGTKYTEKNISHTLPHANKMTQLLVTFFIVD